MYKRTIAATFAAATILVGCLAIAQESRPNPTTQHNPSTQPDSSSLTAQLAELRAAMAKLESSLNAEHTSKNASDGSQNVAVGMKMMRMGMDMMGGGKKSSGMSMGMMKKKSKSGGMGMMSGGGIKMGNDQQTTGSMGMGKNKGMGMGKKMMGMKMMGDMGASVDKTAHDVSALPGFPGASHIYHIGATGFFVDHADHLELSEEQLKTLNTIREGETLKQSSVGRQIDELEQELWVLTSADQPNAAGIEEKIREIGTLTAEKRISFIRSVGRAAITLSKDQIGRLKGEPASDEHNH